MEKIMKILKNVLFGLGLVTVLLAQSDQCSCKWHKRVIGEHIWGTSGGGTVYSTGGSGMIYYDLIENHKVEYSITISPGDDYYVLFDQKSIRVAEFDDLNAAKKYAEKLSNSEKYTPHPCQGSINGPSLGGVATPLTNISLTGLGSSGPR